MKNVSVWSENLKKNNNILNMNITTDILIIGGGLAGILTAYFLNNSSYKVTLVERNQIGSGITSKMTGKVTILQDILTKMNTKNQLDYLKSQIEALSILKNIITTNDIKCHFKKNDSYLYTTKKTNIKKINAIKKVLTELNVIYEENTLKIEKLDNLCDIKIEESYEINPIEYLNSIRNLCTNVMIYENTNIIQIVKDKKNFYVLTDSNIEIKAKKIVFSTNYPYFLKPLFFPFKVRCEKSYIGYGSYYNLTNNNFNLINIDKNVTSIRFYENKMIYLGLSKIIANKVNDEKCFLSLTNKFIKKYDNVWSNIDIITNDYLPIAGQIFNNLYIITGFNTWGILSSHICAKLLADLILKKKNSYSELFNPHRKTNFRKLSNSFYNILESLNGYLKGLFYKNEIIFYQKDKAIYIDSKGNYYVVKRKCPHMKCNLIFNNVEKTWDCPCHASRFDLEGNVISGPSKYSIKLDKNC